MNTQQSRRTRSYFVMTRRGTFRPTHYTSNQCKEPGWPEYSYELRMVFRGEMDLDKDGFIVDHAEINHMIQKMQLTGSCEKFTIAILGSLDKFMSSANIPMVACRCIVRATDPNTPAWLERLHIAPAAPAEVVRLLS